MKTTARLSAANLLCVALLGAATFASADQFELTNGATINGELLNQEQDPRVDYQVILDSGIKLVLPAEAVRKATPKSDAQRSYDALPEPAATADAHWELAQKCRDAGLVEQARQHLETVIELDPEHEGGRFALGFRRVDGQWRLLDAWKREQGLVPYKGNWVFPQDARLDQMQSAYEETQRQWKANIQLWSSWVLKQRGKELDGLRELSAIADPAAAEVLADLLLQPRQRPELRLVYAQTLSRLGGPVATAALARAALQDQNEQIRSKCLDFVEQLGEDQQDQAARLFMAALKTDDPALINRGAVAAARLMRTDAIPGLIDALITKRTVQVGGGGPGISPTFGGDVSGGGGGGGGLSIGGQPKFEKVAVKNGAVRDALAAITGVNQFDYNQEAWRAWYIQTRTPREVDLRRQQ